MQDSSLKKLKDCCINYSIHITSKQQQLFSLYGDFLKYYNDKVNLTAIVDDDEIVKKHFLDSIIVSKYVKLYNKKVIDIGSGAGFPGVPLKIIDDSIDLTLVDSICKKTKFLNQLKNCLNINYSVVNDRAENIGKKLQFREKYDIVVARAVKNLRQLSEYCLPLVSLDGYFIAMKGINNIEQEIEDAREIIQLLGGEIKDIFKYKLASEDDRIIIVIKKISQTPPKYPRLTAQILKNK